MQMDFDAAKGYPAIDITSILGPEFELYHRDPFKSWHVPPHPQHHRPKSLILFCSLKFYCGQAEVILGANGVSSAVLILEMNQPCMFSSDA